MACSFLEISNFKCSKNCVCEFNFHEHQSLQLYNIYFYLFIYLFMELYN